MDLRELPDGDQRPSPSPEDRCNFSCLQVRYMYSMVHCFAAIGLKGEDLGGESLGSVIN